MTQFATNTPLILTGSDSLLFGGWRRLGLAAAVLRKSFWPVTFWPKSKELARVAVQAVTGSLCPLRPQSPHVLGVIRHKRTDQAVSEIFLFAHSQLTIRNAAWPLVLAK